MALAAATGGASSTPTTASVMIAPTASIAPATPTTIPLPEGYPPNPDQPTLPPSGYPPGLVQPTSPPGGYPAPKPTIVPMPTVAPLPPTPRVAPTVPIAPNAITPGNAAQLRPVARLTPPSRAEFEGGFFPSGPIWDVALSNDETRIAVAVPDGVHVYDLAVGQPLGYVDTGAALPVRAYFSPDNRTLFTSSGWDYAPFGATFFEVATGQRSGMLRVPWPAMPHLGTWAYPSPDGNILVIRQGNAARFYEMATRRLLNTWPERWFPATAIVFSPDSRLAAISFGGVAVWEVGTGRLLFRPTPPNTSTTLQPLAAFSPDGRLLATVDGQTLRVWEVAPPRERFQAALDDFAASILAFSPDSQKVVASTYSRASVWSTQTGERLLAVSGYAPQFSPNSTSLVVQSTEERISVWSIPGQQARFTLSGTDAHFTPDGRLLIRVITDTYAFVEADTGALGPTFAAQRVRVLSDGRLLDVRDDGSMRILAAQDGRPLMALASRRRPSPATSVVFLPDGRLAIASGNATVRLDALTDQDPYNLPPTAEQGAWIYQVALAPDGKIIGSASKDGRLALFNSDDFYSYLSVIDPPAAGPVTGELTSVAFSPDGTRMAAGGSDHRIRLWATEASLITPTQILTGQTNWVWGVAFSPDGRQLASASADQTVRIWDARTGELRRTLRGHTATVRSVAYSPDGATLVSGGWDGALKQWETRSGALRRTLSGHTAQVNAVTFSPGGNLIASASHDGTVRLWEAATGREVMALKPEGGPVWAVAFSLDGRRLAAALNDGAVQVWEAP
jgi:WD40 repeat protein